jgi:hypothetical protein
MHAVRSFAVQTPHASLIATHPILHLPGPVPKPRSQYISTVTVCPAIGVFSGQVISSLSAHLLEHPLLHVSQINKSSPQLSPLPPGSAQASQSSREIQLLVIGVHPQSSPPPPCLPQQHSPLISSHPSGHDIVPSSSTDAT